MLLEVFARDLVHVLVGVVGEREGDERAVVDREVGEGLAADHPGIARAVGLVDHPLEAVQLDAAEPAFAVLHQVQLLLSPSGARSSSKMSSEVRYAITGILPPEDAAPPGLEADGLARLHGQVGLVEVDRLPGEGALEGLIGRDGIVRVPARDAEGRAGLVAGIDVEPDARTEAFPRSGVQVVGVEALESGPVRRRRA